MQGLPQDKGVQGAHANEVDGGGPSPGPGVPEASVTTRAALRGAPFWWLSGAFALARFASAAVGAHLVPLLLERGYPAGFVALMVGAIGPLQLLGRLVFAPALGRWSLSIVTAVMFGLLALAFAALLMPGPSGVWVFVALFGASNGASTLSRAGLIAELYGPASYGSINGVLALIVAVVGALAPLLVGAVYAAAGGYTAALWGLVLSGWWRRRLWRGLNPLPDRRRGTLSVHFRATAGVTPTSCGRAGGWSATAWGD
ncbi:hypothetical protein DAETH_46310 (plasmid) [Deinococcus aetherius]|uniref:MFS transporter n=1 Tax=Deinococcus aetherius TaxID=200252 RepID=A0ABM8ALE4_9DEIO|nr:hypothetical protein DAETH_46310 [Deinococcus aetherius]